jgi:tetratricopeptide (TPR) repeat protein
MRRCLILAAALFVCALSAAISPGRARPADNMMQKAIGVDGCRYPLPAERDPQAQDITACDAAIAAHEQHDAGRSELFIIRAALRWNSDGDYDKANDDLIRSENSDEGIMPAARFLRAMTWLRMGRWQKSVAAFTKLIDQHPTCGQCHHYRAIAFLEQGRNEEALRDLLTARDLGVAGLDGSIAGARKAIRK